MKGGKWLYRGISTLPARLAAALVDVFATAVMIAGILEIYVTSRVAISGAGHDTMFSRRWALIHTHCAATPAGMAGTFWIELGEISQNGRVYFSGGRQGTGWHTVGGAIRRAIVNKNKFLEVGKQARLEVS